MISFNTIPSMKDLILSDPMDILPMSRKLELNRLELLTSPRSQMNWMSFIQRVNANEN